MMCQMDTNVPAHQGSPRNLLRTNRPPRRLTRIRSCTFLSFRLCPVLCIMSPTPELARSVLTLCYPFGPPSGCWLPYAGGDSACRLSTLRALHSGSADRLTRHAQSLPVSSPNRHAHTSPTCLAPSPPPLRLAAAPLPLGLAPRRPPLGRACPSPRPPTGAAPY